MKSFGPGTGAAVAASFAFLALASPAAAASADRVQEVVSRQAARATEVLSGYISRDTTNPPGNEIEGARYLQALLEAAGVEAAIYESEPGRGNVYARLAGKRRGGAVVLLSHIDVVPADASRWTHPPLEPVVADGQLWGRGAQDCKGVGTVELLAFLSLAELGEPLERDVIFLASADEEAGGGLGAGWMLEHHPELFDDVEFVLNEGGFIGRHETGPDTYHFYAAEKGPCWFRVVAEGAPGHGSRPADATAVTRLIAALDALMSWERPIRVGSVVAGYFAAYAEIEEERARPLRQLENALKDEEFRDWFLSDPVRAAMVRDTLAPTVLRGGPTTNVIPAEASAEVDARLLPGTTCDDFLMEVRERIGGEQVRVEKLAVAFAPTESPLDNELTRAVERLAAEEGGVVLPGMLTGFTDSHFFRDRGISAYGFIPVAVDNAQRKSVHAHDERITVTELEQGVRRMVRLLHLLDQPHAE